MPAPVWDANQVELHSQRLAEGVHYMVPSDADAKAPRGIPLATTSGIVVGRNGVLVVDTMLNKRLAEMVLAEARRLGGGALLLDLGGRSVEIRDFGFAQTGGDLWVWVPDAKVLFAGNPVIAERPALPWLLDGRAQESLATLMRVRDFLPEGARIVPGHGRVIGKAELDWPIGYLGGLLAQVKAAIAQGATLEQATQSVQMPEYGGYALHGWVHRQVNVGAAYRELKGPPKADPKASGN